MLVALGAKVKLRVPIKERKGELKDFFTNKLKKVTSNRGARFQYSLF